MQSLDNNTKAFLALVKAGLWETEDRLSTFDNIDFSQVLRLAEDQSVVGLVAAGLEHVQDVKVPQMDMLQFIGLSLQLEQQNAAMNKYVGTLVEKMRNADIYTLLVKGQGIALCYERPLWRACGDVDLLLNNENYQKAKDYLIPFATSVETEYISEQHLGMTIDEYVVELHGTLHGGLSRRIDKGLDKIRKSAFHDGRVRTCIIEKTQVFLLKADEDVIYVFTHILQHFYKGGIGLRQICDWCRLLWTYRESLNHGLLESRILAMGLLSEWKAFGVFAVEYLGMPAEAMPLLDDRSLKEDVRLKKKAERILEFVLESGNLGHNRDNSYFDKYPYVVRKCRSLGRRFGDLISHARIFPMDSLRFFPHIVFNGVRSAMRGE